VNETISDLLALFEIEHQLSLAYSKEENAIVERANKEVLRHLKAILKHPDVTNWSEVLPFVQRIFNSSIIKSIGVAPAQIVFGNLIDLNRNIIPDKTLTTPMTDNMSEYMADLISKQQSVITIAQETLLKRDKAHLAHNNDKHLSFNVNDWVLINYPKNRFNMSAPTKLQLPWYGPMRILAKHVDKYEVMDPASGKVDTLHASTMKPFIIEGDTEPEAVALENKGYYLVKDILGHKGPLNKSKIKFKVLWSNDEITWEPYKSLKNNSILHRYLRFHELKRLIPDHFNI
jgi:hypothetical protein